MNIIKTFKNIFDKKKTVQQLNEAVQFNQQLVEQVQYLNKALVASRSYSLAFWSGVFSTLPSASVSSITNHSGLDIWTVFEDMRKDARIGGDFIKLRAAILGRNYSINTPEGGSESDSELVRQVLKRIPRYRRALQNMMKATLNGYSVLEELWFKKDNFIVPRLEERHPAYFQFDKNNNLQFKNVNSGAWENDIEYQFILHQYEPEYESIGTAALLSLYWYWYAKRHTCNFLAMLIQRFSDPAIKAIVPEIIYNDQTKVDKMREFLKQLHSSAVGIFPENTDVSTIEPNSLQGNAAAIQTLLDYCDKSIDFVLLGDPLTTDTAQVGSYARSKTGQDNLLIRAIEHVFGIEETINDQLIPDILAVNGRQDVAIKPVCTYSKEIIDPEIIKLAYDIEHPIPRKWFSEVSGIPEAQEGEEVNQKTVSSGGFPGANVGEF